MENIQEDYDNNLENLCQNYDKKKLTAPKSFNYLSP
jgi:chromosome condensin MukBEF MukE localization factor